MDDKAQYVDWNERADIRADLQASLIVLLAEHDYPPLDRDEVYQEVVAQAEGFRAGRGLEQTRYNEVKAIALITGMN